VISCAPDLLQFLDHSIWHKSLYTLAQFNLFSEIEMRKYYTVEGDVNAKKAKEAYPKLALCDRCVSHYIVISEGDRTYDECAKCGADD